MSKINKQVLQDYVAIKRAGFEGTIDDYLEYVESRKDKPEIKNKEIK
jgi:hypothetical protein